MDQITQLLLLAILQHFRQSGLSESAHDLEKKTKIFFDAEYLRRLVIEGSFEKVEDYLNAFTGIQDNMFSMNMYFKLRKQKFLEAVQSGKRERARRILVGELRPFAPFHEDTLALATLMLNTSSRQDVNPPPPSNLMNQRIAVADQVITHLQQNPVFDGKLGNPFHGIPSLREMLTRIDNPTSLLMGLNLDCVNELLRTM